MNEGFFSKKDTESKTRPDGKIYSCASCGLYKDILSPKMAPFGNFKKQILIIGEAPGEQEDRAGKPWQGRAGRTLKIALEKLGIDLFEDCISINACRCRTIDESGKNRTPTNTEIACCRSSTIKTINEYLPKVIIPLGMNALLALIGHRWKKDFSGIGKWRGWIIPDQELVSWICPTFHPSFIMQSDKAEETIWMQDLKRAVSMINTPLPKTRSPNIKIITNLKVLRHIKSDLISIDYECTGLKPHGKGHRIISAAVAIDSDNAFVFIMPDKEEDRRPFLDLLADRSIGKMAHNMKYEEAWSTVYLKQPVQNWQFDSMLAAHILDNRPGITGLKFQTYVNFGVIDYSSEVDPFLYSSDKGGNAKNKILELIKTESGVNKLLTYNALDTIYEYRLALKQIQEMDYSFLPF